MFRLYKRNPQFLSKPYPYLHHNFSRRQTTSHVSFSNRIASSLSRCCHVSPIAVLWRQDSSPRHILREHDHSGWARWRKAKGDLDRPWFCNITDRRIRNRSWNYRHQTIYGYWCSKRGTSYLPAWLRVIPVCSLVDSHIEPRRESSGDKQAAAMEQWRLERN